MQYWPHRRAQKRLPRLRNAPKVKEPVLCNMVAYKVGMTHLAYVDDSEGPAKNQEAVRAVTVLEVPRMEVYGIRFYGTDEISNYKVARGELYNKALAQKLNVKKLANDESKLESMKAKAKEFTDITALVVAYPEEVSVGQHHPVRFETTLGGKDSAEKFELASKVLGKEIKATDIFKPGEFVDVSGVTTGKGWAGVIKRFHVKRNRRKATNKVRHGGPLGSYGDSRIFYTVPRAGQMGFNYRTEHNKRILKIGAKADAVTINKGSGFKNYGVVKNDFIIVHGSVGGPSKRMVRLRKSIRDRNIKGIKEPKITYIAK